MYKVREMLARDADDLLAYKTPRMVRIRDRRLCFGRLLIILGIFVYVVIYELIINKGYLIRDVPVGVVRLSVRDPNFKNGAPSFTSPPLPSYCGTKPEASTSGKKYGKLPCVRWDYIDAVSPPAEEVSTFISTRVAFTTTSVARSASPECLAGNMGGCGGVATVSPATPTYYYVPFTDEYTLLIQHSVYGKASDVLISQNNMAKGQLLFADADKKPLDVTSGGPDRPGDIITLGTLMEAADISLEDDSSSSAGETLRYSGPTLLLFINYEARQSKFDDLKYKYTAKFIPDVEYKFEETIWDHNDTHINRIVVNRHGMRIVVVQGGYIGRFSFVELLKTLVTATALFGVARFVVDKLIVRYLPLHDVYYNYKYLDTVDFSQVEKKKLDETRTQYIVRRHDGVGQYNLEAHDFVYGTMLRGGYENQPEWDFGKGPLAAYEDNKHFEAAMKTGQSPSGQSPLIPSGGVMPLPLGSPGAASNVSVHMMSEDDDNHGRQLDFNNNGNHHVAGEQVAAHHNRYASHHNHNHTNNHTNNNQGHGFHWPAALHWPGSGNANNHANEQHVAAQHQSHGPPPPPLAEGGQPAPSHHHWWNPKGVKDDTAVRASPPYASSGHQSTNGSPQQAGVHPRSSNYAHAEPAVESEAYSSFSPQPPDGGAAWSAYTGGATRVGVQGSGRVSPFSPAAQGIANERRVAHDAYMNAAGQVSAYRSAYYTDSNRNSRVDSAGGWTPS